MKSFVGTVSTQIKNTPTSNLLSIATGLVMLVTVYFLPTKMDQKNMVASLSNLNSFPVELPNVKYDLLLDTLQTNSAIIKKDEFFVDILKHYDLNVDEINKIVTSISKSFDVKNLRAGRTYHMYCKKNTEKPYYFVYEPDAYSYIKLDMRAIEPKVEIIKRNVLSVEKSASGYVSATLSDAMAESGLSYDLIDQMADALAWTVDFYHVQKGDTYKAIYDENVVDGKRVGSGQLYGACFNQNGQVYYAIYYKKGNKEGFYDLKGRPMKRYFLKAPVKFSRISSGFSKWRFHPVLKYGKPHFGTDYAASAGTPIMSVGNGVVIEAARNPWNGNYVKIRHDQTYSTQYLHMSRFAKGVRKGSRVAQGQTIGYVGSTGLATGPHVCYRFWKHGVQVNPLKERFPESPPMEKSDMPNFNKIRDKMVKKLDAIATKRPYQLQSNETDSLP